MNAMVIQAQDRDHNDYLHKNIPFTDFPEGEWALWLVDGILLLPSEYWFSPLNRHDAIGIIKSLAKVLRPLAISSSWLTKKYPPL